MARLLLLLLILGFGTAHGDDATLALDGIVRADLDSLALGSQTVVDGVPDGYGSRATLTFERIEVRAPGAAVVHIDADGTQHQLPAATRVHLLGRSDDDRFRARLSFEPGFQAFTGNGSGPEGDFVLHLEDGTQLHAVPVDDSFPADQAPRIESIGQDGLDSGLPPSDPVAQALSAMQPHAGMVRAVVAVDTDAELLERRFANNAATANAWIGDLFAALNLLYKRDIGVTLQQGHTVLRTGSDPYLRKTFPPNREVLEEFGAYWQANYNHVPRAFAMLLSGATSSPNSAAGIAWLNAYCRKASYGGSYSINRIFTNPNISLASSLYLVAHELGHNLGAHHTHCTTTTTGAAPAASNTIDQCNATESGCYSGPTSCPSGTPDAPAGTLMSYCHHRSCGSNVLKLAPAQIGSVSALVAANTPSCLAPVADGHIFRNGFER